jgi:hypothetical protein
LNKTIRQDSIYKQLNRLKAALWQYMHQVVMLSYNGQKYDEHLIKTFLGVYFNLNEKTLDTAAERLEGTLTNSGSLREIEVKEMGETTMIKRANSYVCISNRFYRMIDLCNYLPPATSYSAFLKAYDVEETKFYFPYEFLTSYECLFQTHLPPYPSDAWYSSLKQCDLLHHDYEQWNEGSKKDPPPLTGKAKYKLIQEKWENDEWEDMGDYLKYYNSCDTGPMVLGVVKLMKSYIEQNIDIWKDCLSTPGVSRILLMRDAQKQKIIFPLFDDGDKDLHYMMRSQMCAGPSIVFTRWLEKGVTPLALDSDEICEQILGYDCSSLYLGQMLHPMPSQNYVRRFRADSYYPKFKRRYVLMYLWLEMMSKDKGVHIKTRQTQGYECKIGPYFVVASYIIFFLINIV